MESERGIAELARLVQGARRAVAFTGAGISTECGVPDFRSANGLWARVKPIQFQDWLASEATRLKGWERYFEIRDSFRDVQPGRGHRAIAEFVARGLVASVVTQNIDDLHRLSGVPADRIVELHGNGTYAKCLDCGRRHELEWARAIVEVYEQAPACEACGGIVKPATISFGQAMPEVAMAKAEAATRAADLFLAIGSSLQVYPAAGLPILAADLGIPLVIINREPTPLDHLAGVVVYRDIGDCLAQVSDTLAMSRRKTARL